MTEKRCPTAADLLAFADAALPPEQLQRIEKHLEICSICAKQAIALSELIEDVAAPVGAQSFDMAEHVAGVMQRLDEPVPAPANVSRLVWGGTLAAALAIAAAVALRLVSAAPPPSEFAARGGVAERSLARDVGVQLYEQAPLRALAAGSSVRSDATLTAGLRNVAAGRAYLLLFGVDAAGDVHWIAPQYTTPGTDPEATSISPSTEERLLPSSVVFDDLAPGPLRVVAVIGAEPMRVSEVEALRGEQLGEVGLRKRFPRAEVRQFTLEVTH